MVGPIRTDDVQAIRQLLDGWAGAVRRGELDGVLADHGDDVVMFDVPPPAHGVRGREAYAATWPPFFTWLRSGAAFEVEQWEITAGADVAFAFGILRCGTAADLVEPERRLRLTIGLEKRDGRWTVVHEHHSFPELD
jgi:uncharacterized protein (TIGR02246 family)